MNKFPLYIPSKGRSEYMMTSKALTAQGVKHNIVVEPQEVDIYRRAVSNNKLLTTVIPLDMSYKDKYDYCDNKGTTVSTGSGPARNFIWEHSIEQGFSHHWIMDDNIQGFHRLNKNKKHIANTPTFWQAMEDFCLRYNNLAMSGPNYEMFVPGKKKCLPFITNTRIYSCNFIRNNVPFRWRGRYNEDTILSLDMLKAGWCTIQFNAFLQNKTSTQLMRGGNTDSVYKHGTMDKSKMLVNEHHDVSKVVFKFGRVHHHVDYRGFKTQKLIRKDSSLIKAGINNYGMELKKV